MSDNERKLFTTLIVCVTIMLIAICTGVAYSEGERFKASTCKCVEKK